MNITIRQEKENEFKEIYDLVKIAFQTAKVSDGKEQDFVDKLRNGDNYIPELALVAEDNNKLVGHIMLSKYYIHTDSCKMETLLLAPISVILEYRNKGVGSSLIKKSFEIARILGYKSVVLVGDPAYYSKFGFKRSADLGIRNSNNIPEEYVQVYELIPDALNEINGTIDLLNF